MPIEIWVGGKPVTVKRYSGRTPCCAGIDQIVFDLPLDTPTGCYVPVQVRTGGVVVSNDVTIAVSADGAPCSDPGDVTGPAMRSGGRLGSMVISRVRLRNGDGSEVGADEGFARFTEESGGPWAFQSDYVSVPPGACQLFAGPGAGPAGSRIGRALALRELDAGAQAVGQAGQGRGIPMQSEGLPGYSGLLGLVGTPAGDVRASIFEPAGELIAGALGGTDVGEIGAAVAFPPTPVWTNRAAFVRVARSQDALVQFEPPTNGTAQAWIVGGVNLWAQDATVRFQCRVPAGGRSFAIPSSVLQRLPAGPDPLQAFLGVAFVSQGQAAQPALAGLKVFTVSAVSTVIKVVSYE